MDEKMAKVLHFYSSLVDRAISSPDVPREPPPTTPVSAPLANSTPSGKQSTAGHRRNLSSLSSSSLNIPPPPPPTRSAADFATTLFLDHPHPSCPTSAHLHSARHRCPDSPSAPVSQKNNLEDKITEMLSSILSGPYSATSMLVLRQHLFPSSPPQPSRISIMTSLGAHRTLRNHVRRALCARLARAYISRESSMGYSHSGAPVHLELQGDLMEKAWPKDDYTTSSVGVGGIGWDAARLGKALAESVGAWIKHEFDDANVKSEEEKRTTWEKEREGKDEILEEAAGILKDILQELDLREEDDGGMNEEEAEVVGRTLLQLSGYVLPLKNQDGLPFIIPIGHPVDAPTPILRTVSSLLSRDYSRTLNPLLSTILIHVAEHLTDSDTSRLPILMMEQQDLSPTSPEWLDNWRTLLENQTLMAPDRPLMRRTLVEALQSMYISVKDMTRYHRPLGDLVASFCEQDDDENPAFIAELMPLLDLLVKVMSEPPPEEDEVESSLETSSINTADTHSPGGPWTVISPTLSQLHVGNPPSAL
ncbi:hypothetical protein NLJ89_g11998 [Agrocybe chaxingu]|uniref:Uncharacterized protein n=1 Tax=Agrocybe chaxingu TaxID=84603 RepID=A0A9W8MMJ5_9AGAR|nr:hypothetical protein NLJ89_g11998 [Agrocybe chaxingu]